MIPFLIFAGPSQLSGGCEQIRTSDFCLKLVRTPRLGGTLQSWELGGSGRCHFLLPLMVTGIKSYCETLLDCATNIAKLFGRIAQLFRCIAKLFGRIAQLFLRN